MLSIAPPKSIPQLSPGSQQPLGIHSTVGDLPLYTFTISGDYAASALMESFMQWRDLPGVIISEAGRIHVLSKQQFLESWLQQEQTLSPDKSPVRCLLRQANYTPLTLLDHTPVLSGAQQALKRAIEQHNTPLLIKSMKGHTEHYHLLDAHALNVAHWQIRGIELQIRYERLQMQLLQSEKMAALGRLVDGVAHEILDPVSFIWGNLSYIADYAKQQAGLISAYENALPQPPAEIAQLKEDIEFDYVRSDLPAAIESARGGANRLRQLATSLQNFCHIDAVHPRPTDLNTLLESTLRLLTSHLTTPISIERAYGKLPPVSCFSGQLSQVFMNIFTYAIDDLLEQAQQREFGQAASARETSVRENHAINTPVPSAEKMPKITVATSICTAPDSAKGAPHEARWVSIIISDNGSGLIPQTKARIIESFSAQNRLRQETGLALSYQIITAKHGGKFWMRSLHASEKIATPGETRQTGTEFKILLPLTLSE